MGDGEYNNLKFYMINKNTGEAFEMGEPKEIDISETDDFSPEIVHSVSAWTFESGTFSCDLTIQDVVGFKRRAFPESLNNYRKLHGMPLIRKRKRWR